MRTVGLAFLTVVFLQAGGSSAFGVAPAEEQLLGCWLLNEPNAPPDNDGFPDSFTLCFEAADIATTSVVGGSLEFGGEGLGAEGRYNLSGNLLHFWETAPADAWPFGAHTVCTAEVANGKALQLSACTGLSDYAAGWTTFVRK